MEVVDIRNRRTDLVEEDLVARVAEACDHQEAVEDIGDILALLVAVDNSVEDIVDVRNADRLAVDEECKPVAVHLAMEEHMSAS